MIRVLGFAAVFFVSVVVAAEISEKFSKRLESVEATYQSAVQKADNTRFYAVQKANQERLKSLKAALSDATKAGDFDAATAVKARVTEAETIELPDPSDAVRGRPQFVAALYGVNQSWIDVTDKLNGIAMRKGGLPLIVTDEVFGDPAPEYAGGNSLVVRYLLNGKLQIQAVYVGRELAVHQQP